METKLALRYTGPAVESGSMDVYEASANMIAFSEFVVFAAKATFGDSVSAHAEVAGFGRGSFVTELVFNVGAAATIFSSVSPDQLWHIIKDAFAIWKHLRGQPPSHVNRNGQSVVITNNNGEVIQVRTESLVIVMSEKGGMTASKFIKSALEKPGMDAVEISSERAAIGRVTQSESAFFVPLSLSENITDVTVKMALMIEAPVFKDGNKWRFSDGQQSFYADIEDSDFLEKVNNGERFGKGDVLVVDVQIKQEQNGMKINTERSILKVHEHRTAPVQASF